MTRADVGARLLAALSFDDGPAEGTEAVLDLLAAHGARATFFVLGRQVGGREHTLRRAVAEGHELGNHTWSHVRASELASGVLRDELARTSDAIEAATGSQPRLGRPPYGDGADAFARAAAAEGLATVLWSVDPEDWRGGDAAVIAAAILDGIHPGAIVDLHDGWGSTSASRRPTVDALAVVLPVLVDAGWTLSTVSGLLAASNSNRNDSRSGNGTSLEGRERSSTP